MRKDKKLVFSYFVEFEFFCFCKAYRPYIFGNKKANEQSVGVKVLTQDEMSKVVGGLSIGKFIDTA